MPSAAWMNALGFMLLGSTERRVYNYIDESKHWMDSLPSVNTSRKQTLNQPTPCCCKVSNVKQVTTKCHMLRWVSFSIYCGVRDHQSIYQCCCNIRPACSVYTRLAGGWRRVQGGLLTTCFWHDTMLYHFSYFQTLSAETGPSHPQWRRTLSASWLLHTTVALLDSIW